MKGMLDFLEKAGLVRQDTQQLPSELLGSLPGAAPPSPTQAVGAAASASRHAPPEPWLTPPAARSTTASTAAASLASSLPASAPAPAAASGSPSAAQAGASATPPKLEEIYAKQGVPPSPYPAERLLRVIDGLSAMDQATRDMAIKAIDAADESWTIADPLADAQAKAGALGAHAARVQAQLRQLEQETQNRLGALRARQDKVVGDIRKQMAELEALAVRETARAAQESAALEMGLKSAKDRASWELDALAQTRARLQGLLAQYGQPGVAPAAPG